MLLQDPGQAGLVHARLGPSIKPSVLVQAHPTARPVCPASTPASVQAHNHCYQHPQSMPITVTKDHSLPALFPHHAECTSPQPRGPCLHGYSSAPPQPGPLCPRSALPPCGSMAAHHEGPGKVGVGKKGGNGAVGHVAVHGNMH